MRGLDCHPMANQRPGEPDESEWPVVTAVVTIIRPGLQTWAISGQTRLMNVGCHTAIDMDSKPGFFKCPPTNIFIVTTRHSLHFSSSSVLRLLYKCIHWPLEMYGLFWCLDVWPVRCGGVMRMGYVIYSQIRIWTFEKWNMKLLTMLLAGPAQN